LTPPRTSARGHSSTHVANGRAGPVRPSAKRLSCAGGRDCAVQGAEGAIVSCAVVQASHCRRNMHQGRLVPGDPSDALRSVPYCLLAEAAVVILPVLYACRMIGLRSAGVVRREACEVRNTGVSHVAAGADISVALHPRAAHGACSSSVTQIVSASRTAAKRARGNMPSTLSCAHRICRC
jgi:hypothetical protein